MKIASEQGLTYREPGRRVRISALCALVVALVVALLCGLMSPSTALASTPLTTYDAAYISDPVPTVARPDISGLTGRAPPVGSDSQCQRGWGWDV